MIQKILIICILMICHRSVIAQNYQVISLFQSDTFAPYMQIPFKISGAELPFSSMSATLLDDTNDVCSIMQDPFIGSNFLLRCNSAAVVRIVFEIRAAQITRITYGPIEIKDLDDLVLVDSDNPALQQQISMGQALFSSNCINCHFASNLRDRTAPQIRAMIQNQREMKIPVLQGLSNTQLEYIATYLRNLESL